MVISFYKNSNFPLFAFSRFDFCFLVKLRMKSLDKRKAKKISNFKSNLIEKTKV